MLEEQIFNLKLNSKSLARQSAKCEKDEKTERSKVKAVRRFAHQINRCDRLYLTYVSVYQLVVHGITGD